MYVRCASLSLNMTARAATTFAFSLVKLPALATMTMYDVLERDNSNFVYDTMKIWD